jgi:AMP nucleosidase
MAVLPPFIAPTRFTDPAQALAHAQALYQHGIQHLRQAMQRFVAGETFSDRVRACYPFVRIQIDTVLRTEKHEGAHLSYGFVAGPGRYETTLTRPDLYGPYYLEQFSLLMRNHGVALEIGFSHQPIPIHFSFA